MPHVIIRGTNGRRHEVDFEDSQIAAELHANETTVEPVIEALDDDWLREKNGFASISLPRGAFDTAVSEQARLKIAPLKAVE